MKAKGKDLSVEKGNLSPRLVLQPNGLARLGDTLIAAFENSKWTTYRGAVAFVKASGMRHLYESVSAFVRRADFEIAVGVDHRGTSKEGLEALLAALQERGKAWIFHNARYSTFHPKAHYFRNSTSALAIIGSGNFTEGGLYTNYEINLELSLDLSNASQKALAANLEAALEEYRDPRDGTAKPLDRALIDALVERGYVDAEARSTPADADPEARPSSGATSPGVGLFAASPVAPAPKRVSHSRSATTTRPGKARARPAIESGGATAAEPSSVAYDASPKGFLMTLQKTDVGVGQTTRGTSRRSPEIFIPLSARDEFPEFWGWRDQFTEDPGMSGKFDRHGVRMRFGGGVVAVNMGNWPPKHDFRLRNEQLRSAGNIGDILRIEKVEGVAGIDYYVEVVLRGTSEFSRYQALCRNRVRNSRKAWGYY